MVLLGAEQRSTNVVWPIHEEDVLARSQPSRDSIEVGDKVRAITLTDIGQKAKQVMSAQANCHENRIGRSQSRSSRAADHGYDLGDKRRDASGLSGSCVRACSGSSGKIAQS